MEKVLREYVVACMAWDMLCDELEHCDNEKACEKVLKAIECESQHRNAAWQRFQDALQKIDAMREAGA